MLNKRKWSHTHIFYLCLRDPCIWVDSYWLIGSISDNSIGYWMDFDGCVVISLKWSFGSGAGDALVAGQTNTFLSLQTIIPGLVKCAENIIFETVVRIQIFLEPIFSHISSLHILIALARSANRNATWALDMILNTQYLILCILVQIQLMSISSLLSMISISLLLSMMGFINCLHSRLSEVFYRYIGWIGIAIYDLNRFDWCEGALMIQGNSAFDGGGWYFAWKVMIDLKSLWLVTHSNWIISL